MKLAVAILCQGARKRELAAIARIQFKLRTFLPDIKRQKNITLNGGLERIRNTKATAAVFTSAIENHLVPEPRPAASSSSSAPMSKNVSMSIALPCSAAWSSRPNIGLRSSRSRSLRSARLCRFLAKRLRWGQRVRGVQRVEQDTCGRTMRAVVIFKCARRSRPVEPKK
jgi:hypothetical protein